MTERLCVSGSRRGEYDLISSSDDDLSSLAVDTEGQTARFVAKTLRVCSILVALIYTGPSFYCCYWRVENVYLTFLSMIP